MLNTRNVPCALGIDSGYANTGVAIVTTEDFVLMTDHLVPPRDRDIQGRITWLCEKMHALMQQYEPVVIGLETYTAPSMRTRAMSAQAVAWHNWLIGALIRLPGEVRLLEAKYWQHTLTGIQMAKAIGGKDTIQQYVEMRTGYVFTKNSGGHKSDAAGIALVALDEWQLLDIGKSA